MVGVSGNRQPTQCILAEEIRPVTLNYSHIFVIYGKLDDKTPSFVSR